jgi:hypothetical protein
MTKISRQGEGTLPVKELAQAISALINASPRSPRIDEIEALIRQYMPSIPQWDGEWHSLTPGAAAGNLASIGRRKMAIGAKVPLAPEITQEFATHGSGQKAIILYAHPLLLIDPQDDQRTIAGILVKPRRLHVVWYDEEQDCIRLTLISPWGGAQAIVPEQYAGLMKAWSDVRQLSPTP